MNMNEVETIKDFSKELRALRAELKSRGSHYFIFERPMEFTRNGKKYPYTYWFLCKYIENIKVDVKKYITYHKWSCLGRADGKNALSESEAYVRAIAKVDNGF